MLTSLFCITRSSHMNKYMLAHAQINENSHLRTYEHTHTQTHTEVAYTNKQANTCTHAGRILSREVGTAASRPSLCGGSIITGEKSTLKIYWFACVAADRLLLIPTDAYVCWYATWCQ